MARCAAEVVLLDLSSDYTPGIRILEQIKEVAPPPSVLVMCTDESEVAQLECARRGASGFLRKSEAAAFLLEAIRAVAAQEVDAAIAGDPIEPGGDR